MIMVLEDRGVRKEAFIDLQDAALAEIYLSEDSLNNFRHMLKSHSLGNKFRLSFILEQLHLLGLDLQNNADKKAIESDFLRRLLRCSMVHVLREIKFKARIPVPNSYQLVGVADEGQAYIREGANPEDVFTLPEGHIYGTVSPQPRYLVNNMICSLCARVCRQRTHLFEGYLHPLQESSDPSW
jgi:RNA-dependent RNA polymerase